MSRPFELHLYAAPMLRVISLSLETQGAVFQGGFSPEQARELAANLEGAADVAEGKLTTERALSFLARQTTTATTTD